MAKGRIEKNHVLIRQILPKGTKFSTLSDESVHLITEHINSVTRELFENQTPFDLMSQKDEYKNCWILSTSTNSTQRSLFEAGITET